jgi:hypothetical protein
MNRTRQIARRAVACMGPVLLVLALACTDAGNPVFPVEHHPEPVVVDFEHPRLAGAERQVIDPYIDEATGIWFAAKCPGSSHGRVGFVRNDATSACVEPASGNQKLGSCPDGADCVGLGCFAMAAVFPDLLEHGGEITVDFQSLVGCELRLQLFDVHRRLLAETRVIAGEAAGTCGNPGGPRALTTLSTRTWGQLAYVVMSAEVGKVLVIDNFRYVAYANGLR